MCVYVCVCIYIHISLQTVTLGMKRNMHDSFFLEVEFKDLCAWNCECKKLTVVPKFLTGIMERIVVLVPKRLNLMGVTMV